MMKYPILFTLILVLTKGASCRSKIDDAKPEANVNLADEEEGTTPPPPLSLPSSTPPPKEEMEDVGRYLLAQAGLMMCYQSWENDPKVNFHRCYVCFNDTIQPQDSLSEENHIIQVESCANQYIPNTDYHKECLPHLRDSSVPSKSYDVLLTEPPFYYSYQKFVRCAHGVTFKQEAVKCVTKDDVVQGLDTFLDRFGCLMKSYVEDSRRFSDANLAELLNSVPEAQLREQLRLQELNENATTIIQPLNAIPQNTTTLTV